MPDKIFPQDGDEDTGLNFSEWLNRGPVTDYVESGCALAADYETPSLDIGSGDAYLSDGGEDKHVHLDSRFDLPLTDNDFNHVYIDADFGTDDSVSVVINTDGTVPPSPSLKLGIVDTSANTEVEHNRGPDATLSGLTVIDDADSTVNHFRVTGDGDIEVVTGDGYFAGEIHENASL